MKLFTPKSGPARRPPRQRLVRALLWALPTLAIVAGLGAWQGLQGRQAAPGGAWVPVASAPLAQPIVVEGALQAASAVNIAAPFDGRIVRRWVQAGDSVQAGAPLVQLDATEVLAELREAQVAQIRAREALDDLLHWSSSAEVAGAQRQLAAGRGQVETAQSRLAETRTLFDKGIVARADVEAAQSELANANTQWQSAQDSLSSALRKGSADQLRIARLEFQLRSARAEMIQARLARATVTAPQAGVVLAPPADATSGSAPREFEAGSFVTTREALMTIGDTSMFMVRAQLDGFDAVRVSPGMPVEVTLGTDEGTPMGGALQRVSAQARRDAGSGGNGPPMFDIQVLIREVAPERRARLRLGMTVRLRMVVEPKAMALSIPLAAVNMGSEGRTLVMRRSAAGGPGEAVAIEPGGTLPDRVIVRRGLAPDDVVWVPRQPAGTGQPEPAEAVDPQAGPSPAWPFSVGEPP